MYIYTYVLSSILDININIIKIILVSHDRYTHRASWFTFPSVIAWSAWTTLIVV